MKKTILFLTALCGPIFGSNISMNDKNTIKEPKVKTGCGHFIFSLGKAYNLSHLGSPIFQWSVGYQSAVEKNSFFQSQLIEFGGGASFSENHFIWFHPKITGLHYFNIEKNTRYYMGTGGGIANSLYSNTTTVEEIQNDGTTVYSCERDSYHALYLMGALSLGIEMGDFNGVLNALELSYDQPLLEISYTTTDNKSLYTPSFKLSYRIGF